VQELVRAKVEQRAPEVQLIPAGQPSPKVINIMQALKQSMQAKGRAKVRDAVRRRTGKEAAKSGAIARPTQARVKPSRTAH
jgi:non-homologous end joining protein Ku